MIPFIQSATPQLTLVGYACRLKPEYRLTFHVKASLLIITVHSCRLVLAKSELSSSEAVNGCTVRTAVSYVNLQGGLLLHG